MSDNLAKFVSPILCLMSNVLISRESADFAPGEGGPGEGRGNNNRLAACSTKLSIHEAFISFYTEV